MIRGMIMILRKFLFKEDGQTLGLFALVALALVVAIMFVYNIGDFFIFCIREQNAVDAAAISAASIQADYLNEIVRINKLPFPQAYLGFIWACRLCCACCGAHCGCCCSICPAMSAAMRAVEFSWRLLLWSKVVLADINSIRAAQNAYRSSGGKGKIFPVITPLASLPSNGGIGKIVEIRERVPKARTPSPTFCGVGEKKRNQQYDWAGGIQQYPEIMGSYEGYYDKRGPAVVCTANVTYTPKTLWFNFNKKLIFKAAARPYGGNVHPKRWRYGWRGWGSATFTAKLVPVKSVSLFSLFR